MDSTTVLQPAGPVAEWTYLATYGKQSLNNDLLGLAILYRAKDLIQTAEDKYSHVVVLKPTDGELTYGFLAAWEQEPGGIRSADAFAAYLDETVSKLNGPLVVSL
jgi:hypothetical protein